MVRILICDDEGIVQESLKFMIQKSFGDACETESAKNGRTAIELADSFRPDIILMDIQMPGINGIDAMREIRKNNKNVIFIVLTAYDKFTYTQSSIDIGVMAYLTKPASRGTLTETLQREIKAVKGRKEKASYDLEVKEKLEAVVPIIENGFVYSILLEGTKEDEYPSYREFLNIQEEYGYVMVMECGEEYRQGNFSNAMGAGIKLQKHQEMFRETVKDATEGIVGALMANRVAVLMPCSKKEEPYEVRVQKIDQIHSMLRKLESQFGLNFKAGIGTVQKWKFMSKSYKEAMEAVRQGMGKVTHAGELSLSCIYEESYPDELERELFDAVEWGSREETGKLAARFFAWMAGTGTEISDSVRIKAMEFVLWAERIAYMKGGRLYRFSSREGYLKMLLSFQAYGELEVWFIQKMEEASSRVAQKQKEKGDNVVERAKEYIAQNFAKELTLDEMAKEVGISPYYLSKLFKEVEGVNYIEYLTGLRMDHAKGQLLESDKSIKEVCHESGYGDPNYFSRIFKKWVGVTPTESREGKEGIL